MTATRRDLLSQTGAAALFAWAAAAGDARAQTATDDDDEAAWKAVRALFPLDPALVHMSSFFFAAHPQPVRAAIEAHRRGLDAEPVGYLNKHHHPLDRRVRAAAGRYLGVAADEVFLTDSTTMGLGLVYGGLLLGAGDDVVATTHDHWATYDSLGFAAARAGATIRKVALYDDPARANADEMASRLSSTITPATRVVAATWVHSSTGVKLPIARLAEVLRGVNNQRPAAARVLLCVDGVHGLGIEDGAVSALGCDVLVAGTHKSLHGPRGTGVVWVRSSARPRFSPIFSSLTDHTGWGGVMTPGGFHSFEHRWALEPAFELHTEIGKAQIAARIHGLARRLKVGLANIDGVVVNTPMDESLSASLVAFAVKGHAHAAVVRALRGRQVVATTSPYAQSAVRLAPAIFSLDSDVDRAVAAVAAVARS